MVKDKLDFGTLLLVNFHSNNKYIDNGNNNKLFRVRNIWRQAVRKKQWTISADFFTCQPIKWCKLKLVSGVQRPQIKLICYFRSKSPSHETKNLPLSQHRREQLKSLFLDAGSAASAWGKTVESQQPGNQQAALGPASCFPWAVPVSAELGLRKKEREKRNWSLDQGNASWFLCLQCLREQNSFHSLFY